MVWWGVAWCGLVWCDGVCWGGVGFGVVWCGVVWCGVVWCGVVLHIVMTNGIISWLFSCGISVSSRRTIQWNQIK